MASSGSWQSFYYDGMQYQLLLPDGYDPSQSYPVLLYLHGGGQESRMPGMTDPWFNTPEFRADYPAIVVEPILPGSSLGNTWGGYPINGTANSTGENQALAILQNVMSSYAADRSRVYVTGVSLGGRGSWDLIMKDNVYNGPQGRIFAAAMPLAGAINAEGFGQLPTQAQIDQLRDVPIWAVHGGDGDQGWDAAFLMALGNSGAYHATLNFTLGHDVWDTYYPLPTGKPYYDWMFSQSASGVDGWTKVAALDTSTGGGVAAARQAYSGPVADIWNQYVAITPDSLNIAVGSSGWFLHSGAGDDALAAYSGTNVLDGGTGSNFLVGGSGTDTFFVDARGAAADIWSTLANFHAGDAATLWGVDSSFALDWQEGQGAAGYTGLTLHASTGVLTASVTLAGYSRADMDSGRISVSFGSDPGSGSAYLYLHANS